MGIQNILVLSDASGPEMPSIGDFLPAPFLFGGTPFAFNRLDLIRIVVLLFIMLFFGITLFRAAKRSAVGNHIPTKPQSAIEMLFEFIRGLVYDSLGAKAAKKWLPMATTMFCTIIFMNLTGVIPGLNLAATAGIGIPLVFGLWVFTAYWRTGIKEYGGGLVGAGKFVKAELFPPGLPFYVYPIYAIIELTQLLIVRPLSLAIRLFANMMSGHILIALCLAATQYFIVVAGPSMKAFGVLTFIGGIAAVCFELLVACLQAYIFTLLMCAYISMSSNHSEEHAPNHA